MTSALASSVVRDEESLRIVVRPYTRWSDLKGMAQVLPAFVSLALIWWAAASSARISLWLTVVAVPLISLFTFRVFTLMHECGHGSLFRSRRLNRSLGFLLGVAAGMPQYVWSQHHNYHHAHNGNWDKCRGPYTTLSVDEYPALSAVRQWMYRRKCWQARRSPGSCIWSSIRDLPG